MHIEVAAQEDHDEGKALEGSKEGVDQVEAKNTIQDTHRKPGFEIVVFRREVFETQETETTVGLKKYQAQR